MMSSNASINPDPLNKNTNDDILYLAGARSRRWRRFWYVSLLTGVYVLLISMRQYAKLFENLPWTLQSRSVNLITYELFLEGADAASENSYDDKYQDDEVDQENFKHTENYERLDVEANEYIVRSPTKRSKVPVSRAVDLTLKTKNSLIKESSISIQGENEVFTGRKRNRTKIQEVNHPHGGARDAEGFFGYVANVTMLHNWMIEKECRQVILNESSTKEVSIKLDCSMPFQHANEYNDVCERNPGTGIEGQNGGWDVMTKILDPINTTILIDKSMPSILCVIYTYDREHNRLIPSVAETWGWRCDGFFAASNKTIQTKQRPSPSNMSRTRNTVSEIVSMYENSHHYTAIIDLVHEGPENYGNMWQKTRSIFAYIYDHYLNQFDYFFVCGSDTHLIVENLKLFLRDYEKQQQQQKQQSGSNLRKCDNDNDYALLLGSSMKDPGLGVFLGGGSGYVLSRCAVKLFVEIILPKCEPHKKTSMEDIYMGRCFEKVLNITITEAVDENGKQRLFGKNPSVMVSDFLEEKFYKMTIKEHWAERYGYKSKHDLISPTTISFHGLWSPVDMKRHHAVLYYKDWLTTSKTRRANTTKMAVSSTTSSLAQFVFKEGGCLKGSKLATALMSLSRLSTNKQLFL